MGTLNYASRKLNVKKDTQFIKREIMAKLKNGNLVKWNKVLQAVTVVDMPPEKYIEYWEQTYKNESKEIRQQILDCCKEKLQTGLIDPEKMLQLVKMSKDYPKEKQKVIKLLTTGKIEKKVVTAE